MNQLRGTIAELQSCQGLSLVKVNVSGNNVLSSLVLDDTQAGDWLVKGKLVKLYFKEAEVIISKDAELNISIQNRLPCIIYSLKIGEILGQVDLLFNETRISSVITANACRQLNLKENDRVIALIKTNEISLTPDD